VGEDFGRRPVVQGFLRSVVVVVVLLGTGFLAHVSVEELGAQTAVEALEIAVLCQPGSM